MRTSFGLTIAAGMMLSGAAAHAQGPQWRPGPGGFAPLNQSPAFSPYLNLNRGGTNAGINYYGLVRPQIAFQNSINNLQQQVDQSTPGTGLIGPGGAGDTPVLLTGNRPRFLNSGGYFMNGFQAGNLGGMRGTSGGYGGGGRSMIISNQGNLTGIQGIVQGTATSIPR